ncbi:MAG: penicillin-insensitive murein endopeptidase [Polyangiales bacterium]
MRRSAAFVALSIASISLLASAEVPPSTSVGSPQRGHLVAGVALPASGAGFRFQTIRGNPSARYGTEEMVAMLLAAVAGVESEAPGSLLVIGDLSLPEGGRIHGHGSHTSGRDVDIRYYALDEGGEPRSEPNVDFGRNGRASDGGRFDVERNWLFIRSALESELADVQYIFIYGPLERLLLEHAEANGASPELLQEAARKMMPPGGGSRVSPHADHMHIRILCTAEDEAEGCLNRNSRRRRR